LIGYLETDDFEAAQKKMAVTEVNERWQREMGDYFVELEGDAPDTSIAPLREIFHVD
jgi:L-rhamnose mutarotase